jgi:hypothetical protein
MSHLNISEIRSYSSFFEAKEEQQHDEGGQQLDAFNYRNRRFLMCHEIGFNCNEKNNHYRSNNADTSSLSFSLQLVVFDPLNYVSLTMLIINGCPSPLDYTLFL